MECAQCNSANADGSKYCSNCGFRLDSSLNLIKDYLAANLPGQVQDAVRNLTKDQKVVEIEINEAIATRLSNWAKLLGFFAGISITVLVVALGIVGIKSVADIRDIAKSAENDLSSRYQKEVQKVSQDLQEKFRSETEKQTAAVKKGGARLLAEYQEYKTQLDEARRSLVQRVNELEKKVEKFEIKPSPSLTEEIRVGLNAALDSYQKHLIGLGYRPKGDTSVGVEIRPDNIAHAVAYYDDSNEF
jgi:hypothetical protein